MLSKINIQGYLLVLFMMENSRKYYMQAIVRTCVNIMAKAYLMAKTVW